MDQPHPFSPPNLHQPFPLSFFEEDMLLFTGGGQNSSQDLAAWENMGIGQGRSVSSIMDPYNLDLQNSNGNNIATSPTLQSPMDTSGAGFGRPGGGGVGGVGKKRGSNVDVLGNPLPLPPTILLSHNHAHHNSLEQQQQQRGRIRRKSSSSSSSGIPSNSFHNNAIIISETGNMNMVFDHNHTLNLTSTIALHYLDSTMDMTSNTNMIIEEDEEREERLRDADSASVRQSSGGNGLSQPQKRRRKDTTAFNTATTNNGSNTDDLSSNDDDTGSGNDGRRRESLVDGKRPERPRLTEEEKKNNHIASEQKRRMAIRDGFDRLTELVPGIEGQGRSESVVLKKTVDYMRKVIEDRRNLIAQVQELGGEVPQDLLLR